MALPEATSGTNPRGLHPEEGHLSDKDKIIERLANENQHLVWKVSELEEIIENLQAKAESLERKITSLTLTNNTLRDQMDTQKINRRYTYVGAYEQRMIMSAEPSVTNDPLLHDEPRKKRPSLPPPPIPPLQLPQCPPSPSSTSPSPSPLPSPDSSSSTTPTGEESGWTTGKGAGGWSTGTVERRRDSGAMERGKVRMSLILSQNGAAQSSPLSPDNKHLDATREERAKTSPIPAPSPAMVPPFLARAVSLSSPVFPDPELTVSLPQPETPTAEEHEEEEESPDLILANHEETGKTFVKGGTLDKLIERLTYDKSPETDYAIAFLLTYRSFTTPMELIEKLIARYNLEPKEGIIGDTLTNFDKRKKIIQLRVGNVLKMWIDKHFHDFEKDPDLVARVAGFVDAQILTDMETIGKTLKKLLTNSRTVPVLSWSTQPPTSITPKSSYFGDFDPLEVARQLTLIEYDLYKSIESKECLNQAWNKADKEEKSPHIVAMIKRFNLVSSWVATEIVKMDKMSERVQRVKIFITIAKHCRDIGNFNAVMEILAGLENSAVYRLKKTWEKVFAKAKYQELHDSLMNMMSNNGNFRDYRAALHSCQPPCIPYLGVYLTDLTFIEDGTKNNLNGRDDLIHFEKRRKVSVVIRDIQQYQQTPYHLNVEQTVKDGLLSLECLEEKSLYKYSLLCEPREPKDATLKREFSIPSFLSFSK